MAKMRRALTEQEWIEKQAAFKAKRQQERNQVCKLFHSLGTAAAVAKYTGYSSRKVRELLTESGVTIRRRGRPRKSA